MAVHCLVYALQPGHYLATFCKHVFTTSAPLERHHVRRLNDTFKLYLVLKFLVV